jgi:phthiodiolone/phenolphthiodiolone dimycocerosates ketoreductase
MKFGVAEQPLNSRIGAMTLAQSGFHTARMTGADSYWLPDHLNGLLPPTVMTSKYFGAARLVPHSDAFLEPWTALGHLAGRHRLNRMRLGTAVTDTGRRNPAVTAQAAATLHLMTRGRAILGIGTGEREGNEPYGVDWAKPVARFEEAMATIRALWSANGSLVNRDSPFFPLHNASFALPPVKGKWPPIWIASHGPRMLRATGRYADAWFPVVPGSPERYADGLAQVRSAASDAGRPPDSVTGAATFFLMTGRTSDDVAELLESVPIRSFGLLLPAWMWAQHGARHPLGEDSTGFQDIIPQTIDEQTALAHAAAAPTALIRQGALVGTPGEVLEQLAEWRDHGVQYPVLINVSLIQPKLRRGLATSLPAIQIMRALRKL